MSRTTAAERAAIDSRRVRRVYAVLARVYDGAFDWALGPGRRRAVAALPISAGERVLEVGVGTGLSLPFYPEHCHVTGIDISEAMLEQAHERAEALGEKRFDLRLMDARQLGYPDGTFDHVLAPYVISVVPEPHKVMREIARVCRPGGTVVVVNHFHGTNRLRRLVEGLLTPASQWIGFRMDVPVETATEIEGLELVRTEKVNLLGWWQLLELRRTAEPIPD